MFTLMCIINNCDDLCMLSFQVPGEPSRVGAAECAGAQGVAQAGGRRQEGTCPLGRACSLAHGPWDDLGTFLRALKALKQPATSEVAFLEAVLHVRRDSQVAA